MTPATHVDNVKSFLEVWKMDATRVWRVVTDADWKTKLRRLVMYIKRITKGSWQRLRGLGQLQACFPTLRSKTTDPSVHATIATTCINPKLHSQPSEISAVQQRISLCEAVYSVRRLTQLSKLCCLPYNMQVYGIFLQSYIRYPTS